MLSSRNPAVSFIATKALHNTVGILGRNRAFISVKYQDGRLILDFLVPLQHTLGSGDAPRVEQIRELTREGWIRCHRKLSGRGNHRGTWLCVHILMLVLSLDKKVRFLLKGLGGGWGWVGSWAGMGLINYDGTDCEVFSLVLCLNCANLHVPCCNWLRINALYKT